MKKLLKFNEKIAHDQAKADGFDVAKMTNFKRLYYGWNMAEKPKDKGREKSESSNNSGARRDSGKVYRDSNESFERRDRTAVFDTLEPPKPRPGKG